MTRARTRARTASVAAASVLFVASLSGCGAGLNAHTSTPYTATLGTDAVIGNMHIDNVLVVDDGNEPELYATLINQGQVTDTLMSVEISGADPLVLPSGGVDIRPADFVLFGPAGTVRVFVHGMKATIGQLVTVTMLFRIAGSVRISALVSTPENLYAGS